MTPAEISELRKQLKIDNDNYPQKLMKLPDDYWSDENSPSSLRQMWRSRDYIVQVHEDQESAGLLRVAVVRSDLDKETGRPLNNIPFKVLQQIKNDLGYGDRDGTILLPRNADWAEFSGYTIIYIHPYRLAYGVRNEPQEETSKIITPAGFKL